jgi:polygalacturonase
MFSLRPGCWMMAAAFACIVALPSSVHAQDTRNVTEPHIPQTCVALKAALSSVSGALAEADESKLDTQRIQDAIDSCAPGQAVALRPQGERNAFLTGPLELRRGVTLVVERGVTLFASRDARLYDKGSGTCGTVTAKDERGCKPLIHVAGATDAGIMGDGVIDARGGARLLGRNVSWWDLAQQAKTQKAYQNCPRMVVAERADNFTLYGITLKNSPNFHVIVSRTNGFTAWGVKIDSPKTARNTDGIDPSSSTNVSILYSFIHAGDDNVAIKAGSAGPAAHITIAHNHFYTGHGMSIGSETNGNVEAVRVTDLTIEGADNGLRVKSNSTRGGFVRDVVYDDVCIRDTKEPIVVDPFYSSERGTLLPNFDDIAFRNVHVLTPGKITLLGTDDYHRSRLTFDGVAADGLKPEQVRAAHVSIAVGPGGMSFTPTGEDVEVSGSRAPAQAHDCSGRFIPFPEHAARAATNKSQLTVASDGSGDFASVQQAIDALPDSGGRILIKPGVYREVVEVSRPHVHLIGDVHAPEKVVMVNDRSAGTSGGTFNSYTFAVTADDFVAEGITFANDFSMRNPGATQGAQAVALAVRGDRAVFRNVRVLGAQDTLLAAAKSCESDTGPCVPSRQYFADCYIEGHVDFIFGDAKTAFHNCEIHAVPHKTVYLAAQSKRYPEQDSGYVFDHCRITAAPGVDEVFLGRPWRRYSTVVFLDTEMPAAIAPAGWHEWHAGETHSLETAYYAEFHSTGPGANPSAREPHSHQLSPEDAARFRPEMFLRGTDNWQPTAPERAR